MTFNLNRVNYDKTTQKLVKNNDRFYFEKEIYLDLFLHKNKEASNKQMAEVEKMQSELKKLKEQLSGLSGSNDIVQQFKNCREFMKSNHLISETQETVNPDEIQKAI